MTFNELVAKWSPVIDEWAVRKGWHKPGQPRTAPHLIGLAMTEIAELEEGLALEDLDNIREEAAGFAVRVIQLGEELNLITEIEDGLLPTPLLRSVDYQLPYAICCQAIEHMRHKPPHVATAWLTLARAVQRLTLAAKYHAVAGECCTFQMWEWLDDCITDEMAKNEVRPTMHGKVA